MNQCAAYEESCSAYLDNELGAREQADLIAHLASCPSCSVYLEQIRAIRAALSPELVAEPPGLRDRIMDGVAQEAQRTIIPHGHRRWRPPVFTMLAAAAAVVLLALSGILGNLFSSVSDGTADVSAAGKSTASGSTGGGSISGTAPFVPVQSIPSSITSDSYAYCYLAQGGKSIPDFGGKLAAQSGGASYFIMDNSMNSLEKSLTKLQDNGYTPELREDIAGITVSPKSGKGLIIVIPNS